MKIFINIILMITAVLVQISLLPQLSFYGGTANLILLVIISLVLIKREKDAILWTIIGGTLLDLFSPIRFGVYLFILLIIYFLLTILIKKLLATPPWHFILFLFFLASIIFDLLWLFYNKSIDFIIITAANAVYNIILGGIIYYLIQYYYQPQEKIKI